MTFSTYEVWPILFADTGAALADRGPAATGSARPSALTAGSSLPGVSRVAAASGAIRSWLLAWAAGGISAVACAHATIEPAALQNAATKKRFDSCIDDIRLLDGRHVRPALDDQYLSRGDGVDAMAFGQERSRRKRVALSRR